MLDYLLYIAGGIFFVMYGLMPLLILAQNKLPARYDLEPMDEETFFSETDPAFQSLFDEIKSNDFRYVASSVFNQQETQARFSLFVHDEKKFSILLTQISNPNVPTVLSFEIGQLYDDDTMLDVFNAPIAGAYPKSSHKVTFRFPEITEVAPLIQAAEHIAQTYLSSKTAVCLEPGKEFKKVSELLNKEQDELIEKGYVQANVKDNQRSLTPKGAYLMTWKMLWPVKQILAKKELAFSHKILSES